MIDLENSLVRVRNDIALDRDIMEFSTEAMEEIITEQ